MLVTIPNYRIRCYLGIYEKSVREAHDVIVITHNNVNGGLYPCLDVMGVHRNKIETMKAWP